MIRTAVTCVIVLGPSIITLFIADRLGGNGFRRWRYNLFLSLFVAVVTQCFIWLLWKIR